MSSVPDVSSARAATQMLLWYRVVTLSYIAVLALTGLRDVAIVSFILAIIYNAFLFKFWPAVVDKLRAYPYLIVLDMAISLFLWVDSGAYKSPYFLYMFGSVMLGGFLYGYFGAFLIAISQSIMRLFASHIDNSDNSYLEQFGEHLFTYVLLNFLIAFMMAYLGALLKKLAEVHKEREVVDHELSKAKEHLMSALSSSGLSKREIEVLKLASEGRTIDEISVELGVSKNTVKTYLKRIYEKLGVSSKQEAISRIIDKGYVLD